MNLSKIFQTEPVLVIGGIGVIAEAALLVGISFGLPITPDQKLTLEGFGTAVITSASAVVARSQVTPVASLPAAPATPPAPTA